MSLHAADWKRLLQGLAPVLGMAVGGPLVAEAVSAIGGALLGKPDATQGEVAAVLSSGQLSAEQIVAIKAADQDFAAKMREHDIDIAKVNAAAAAAEISDTANARATFGSNADVFKIAIWILSGFAILMALVLTGLFVLMTGYAHVDPGMMAAGGTLIGTIVGYLAAIATQITNFLYGSSKGSKDAGQALNTALTETLKVQGEVVKKAAA